MTQHTFRSAFNDPVILLTSIVGLWGVAIYLLPAIWWIGMMLRFGLSVEFTGNDFVNYWMGAQMTLAGEHQQLFVHELYFARLQQKFGEDFEIHSWSYPPHFLLFIWPLGFFKLLPALSIFLTVTFALFVFAAIVFRRVHGPASAKVLVIAVAAYSVMMIAAGQNGFMTGAALLFGLALMKVRPAIAGLAFAFLTVKPQLGFLIPVLLLFDRNWATLRWSIAWTLILLLVSVAIFGWQSWYAYLTETLSYQRSVMTDWFGIFLRMMPTTFGSMRTLGFTPETALLAQWPVSIAGLGLVLWLLWREVAPLRRAFAVVCGTFLVTPYAFNYDMGALAVIAAVLVGSQHAPKSREVRILIALVSVLPSVITNLGRSNVPVTPLLLAAALAALAWESRKRRQDESKQVSLVPIGA